MSSEFSEIINKQISYMYAIVEIAGQQFKVQKDQKIFVHRLDAEAGKKVDFDNVLLMEDGGKVTLGAPAIKGAVVSAKVEEHVKGDKVIVFRKKRRKGYAKKNGHRQSFTALTIKDIKVGAAKPAAKKAAAKKEDAPKAEAKKPAAKKTSAKKPAAKKAAPKKAADKKDK